MKRIKHYDFLNNFQEALKDWTIIKQKKNFNKEVQEYVDHSNNRYFDQGLVLQATLNHEGIIQSTRMHTKDRFYFKYGRVEITAKLPSGKGTWPAFWMMSQEEKYGPWPKSGEIDILEHVGKKPHELLLCLHTEKYNHTSMKHYLSTYQAQDVTTTFNKYAIEWEEDSITYYFNHQQTAQYKKGQNHRDTSPKGWPFNEDFYLILNLAIGGNLGGEVDYDCFPQQFIIQEISVYQKDV